MLLARIAEPTVGIQVCRRRGQIGKEPVALSTCETHQLFPVVISLWLILKANIVEQGDTSLVAR